MYVIKLDTDEYGARQALLTWEKSTVPTGFAFCPDEFFDVFYSTTPAGFVNITVENDTVTAMEVNWDAYNAYVAEHPDIPDEPEPEPTPGDDSSVWDELDAAYQEGVDSV